MEFDCYVCGNCYLVNAKHDHAGETEADTVSICDKCYEAFVKIANLKGFKINDIGGLA